jgi:hypothetical protein
MLQIHVGVEPEVKQAEENRSCAVVTEVDFIMYATYRMLPIPVGIVPEVQLILYCV